MILGIGVDIVKIDRIEKVYSRFEKRFVNKVLSSSENLSFCYVEDQKKI